MDGKGIGHVDGGVKIGTTLGILLDSGDCTREVISNMSRLAKQRGGNEKGSNDNFEENGMQKEGRPDHEAAPHARWKMELGAEAEKDI